MNAISKTYLVAYADTSICSNQYIYLGGAQQNTAGTYYDTIPITPSIDSVYITTLSIIDISTSTDTLIACDSLTWQDGITYFASNNTATYTLTNAANCDSIITLNLTINYSSTTDLDIAVCNTSYTVPSGDETYTESGIYMDTIPNMVGCDSIMTIYLNVVVVDTSVTVNPPVLISNEEDAIYQWINCETMDPLINNTNQSYTAIVDGIYAVILNEEGCIDTSSCHQIIGVFEMENDFGNNLLVYPNPTTGIVVIDLSTNYALISGKIHNINGELISVFKFRNSSRISLEIDGPVGYYFIEIIATGNKKAIIKVLKE